MDLHVDAPGLFDRDYFQIDFKQNVADSNQNTHCVE